jgi:hypothetical protein
MGIFKIIVIAICLVIKIVWISMNEMPDHLFIYFFSNEC